MLTEQFIKEAAQSEPEYPFDKFIERVCEEYNPDATSLSSTVLSVDDQDKLREKLYNLTVNQSKPDKDLFWSDQGGVKEKKKVSPVAETRSRGAAGCVNRCVPCPPPHPPPPPPPG